MALSGQQKDENKNNLKKLCLYEAVRMLLNPVNPAFLSMYLKMEGSSDSFKGGN